MKLLIKLIMGILAVPVYVCGMIQRPIDVQIRNHWDKEIKVEFVTGDTKRAYHRNYEKKDIEFEEMDANKQYLFIRTLKPNSGLLNIRNLQKNDAIKIAALNPANVINKEPLRITTADFGEMPGTHIVNISKKIEKETTAKTLGEKGLGMAATAMSKTAEYFAGPTKDLLVKNIEENKAFESRGEQPTITMAAGYQRAAIEAKEKGEEEEKLGKWQNVLDLFKDIKYSTITDEEIYTALGLSTHTAEDILNPMLFPDIKEKGFTGNKMAYKKIHRVFHPDKMKLRFVHGEKKAEALAKIINAASEQLEKKELEKKS